MADFLSDNDDLRFYLDKGIDWATLVHLTGRGSGSPYTSTDDAVTSYKDMLSVIAQFAAEGIAPHAAEVDRLAVHLENGEVVFPRVLADLFEQIRAMELHGMCLPRELGGTNCPVMLYFLTSELFARADVSVMAHHSFHGGMAMAMLMYSIQEGTTELDAGGTVLRTRFAEEIQEIARGEAWGSMDITEPNAGSDMGDLRTTATQDDQGRWFVSGQKIFITSGHGRHHFVIARTERPSANAGAPDGLSGLSLFLVRAYTDKPDGSRERHATLERVEEKLGHHGSATVTISFDRTPAELIGKRGDGFRQMLLLMNNARIGVGFEAIGLCEAAFRAARDYAAGRPSMGKTIDKHELIADYFDEMRVDIAALRAMAVTAAFEEECFQKRRILLRVLSPESGEFKRVHEDMEAAGRRSRALTPLLKYLAAEKAVEMARRCLQIHGGAGYMTEYGAEKLLRDALVLPIYEGTSQIQALMATKDRLLAVAKNPKGFAADILRTHWEARTARDPLRRQTARLRARTLSAQSTLLWRILRKKWSTARNEPMSDWQRHMLAEWDPKTDFSPALLHAERLTRLACDAAIAELLLEQSERFPERRALCEAYIERAEPRCDHLLTEIRSLGSRLLAELSGAPEPVLTPAVAK